MNYHKTTFSYYHLQVDDFVYWLKNAVVPEKLIVRSKNKINYIFEISFETKGKNGPFYNKRFFLDNEELQDSNTCIEKLTSLDIIYNNELSIYETFDKNSPELLIKIIEASKKLKKKVVVWISQISRGIKKILSHCHTGIKEWQKIEKRDKYRQLELKL